MEMGAIGESSNEPKQWHVVADDLKPQEITSQTTSQTHRSTDSGM